MAGGGALFQPIPNNFVQIVAVKRGLWHNGRGYRRAAPPARQKRPPKNRKTP